MRPSELLLFALLIGGFLLINFVMQRLARRRREQSEEEAPAEAGPRPLAGSEESWGRMPQKVQRPPPIQPEATEEFWGREPTKAQPPPLRAAAVREAKVQRPVQPSVSAGRRAALMLGSRQGLRQAMVFMAVLGPCRALAPYEEPAPRPHMQARRPFR